MSKLIYHNLMQFDLASKFLTFVPFIFVCAASLAAPSTNMTPDQMKANTEDQQNTSAPYSVESLSKPDLGPLPPSEAQGTQLKVTRIVRPESLILGFEFTTTNQFFFNLSRQFSNLNETADQFTIGISGNSYLHLSYEKRAYQILNLSHEPFWSYGVLLEEPTSDLTAGVLKFENYFLISAFGFESLFENERKWPIQIKIQVGSKEIKALLEIGYAF